MENVLNRSEIAKGVHFTSITDKRYKKNCIKVNFYTRLSEETATENALVSLLLTKSCSEYPTFKELQNKLSRLYSASLSGGVSGAYDMQCLSFTMFALDDRFALNKEQITSQAAGILIDCITEPLFENGSFPEKNIETERKTVIDNIEAILNDKRSYAICKATEILCKGEPMAVTVGGTVERAKKLNADAALDAYRYMLRSMRCEIICVGCNDFIEVKKMFASAFEKIERKDIEEYKLSKSLLKEQCEVVTERLEVNQSKMVLGFKTSCDDKAALVMLQQIYGGTTSSKLFMNVREKMSLCYYCAARLNDVKGIIMVDCGVENANIEKARAEIVHQLDEIKAGNFTDEEIGFARMSVINDYNSIGDKANSVAGWYVDHIIKNFVETPQQAIERYIAADRERIIKAANSLCLDSVYILTSKDDNKEEE